MSLFDLVNNSEVIDRQGQFNKLLLESEKYVCLDLVI